MEAYFSRIGKACRLDDGNGEYPYGMGEVGESADPVNIFRWYVASKHAQNGVDALTKSVIRRIEKASKGEYSRNHSRNPPGLRGTSAATMASCTGLEFSKTASVSRPGRALISKSSPFLRYSTTRGA